MLLARHSIQVTHSSEAHTKGYGALDTCMATCMARHPRHTRKSSTCTRALAVSFSRHPVLRVRRVVKILVLEPGNQIINQIGVNFFIFGCETCFAPSTCGAWGPRCSDNTSQIVTVGTILKPLNPKTARCYEYHVCFTGRATLPMPMSISSRPSALIMRPVNAVPCRAGLDLFTSAYGSAAACTAPSVCQ